MKTFKPFFWDEKFSIWPFFLLPLSLAVNLISKIKFKFSKAEKFEVPIISVGNIYLGGTGKTPLCREIFYILKSLKVNPAFVKKYYKKFQDEQKLLENTGKVFTDKKRTDANNDNKNIEAKTLSV